MSIFPVTIFQSGNSPALRLPRSSRLKSKTVKLVETTDGFSVHADDVHYRGALRQILLNKKVHRTAAWLTCVWFAVFRLTAQELIVNGSFEDTGGTFVGQGSLMSLPVGSTVIPGWTTTNAELGWLNNNNTLALRSPYGSQFLDLTGFHDSQPYGGVMQTITTEINHDYRLSLALGAYPEEAAFSGPMAVSFIAGPVQGKLKFEPAAPPKGNQWQAFTMEFTASDTLTPITITGLTAAGGSYLGLDSVSLVAPPSVAELIVNGSFENTSGSFTPNGNGVLSLPAGDARIPGWTTAAQELVWASNSNPFGIKSPDGNLFLDLTGNHDRSPYAGVTQTVETLPGTIYRLSISLGIDHDFASYRGPVSVSVTAGAATNAFTYTPPDSGNQWGTLTVDFTANAVQTPIVIIGDASAGGHYLALDNVSVMPHTPEILISSIRFVGNLLHLIFNSNAGRTYLLQGRSDLDLGAWPTLAGTSTSASGMSAPIELILAVEPASIRQFYRILQLP